MSIWDIDLDDGRTVTVESDTQPSEQDIYAALNNYQPPQQPVPTPQPSGPLFAPPPEATLAELQKSPLELVQAGVPPDLSKTGPEPSPSFKEELFAPSLELPSTTPEKVSETLPMIGPGFGGQQATAEQKKFGAGIASSLLNQIKGLVEFPTSPGGAATAVVGAAAPLAGPIAAKMVHGLMGLGFGADVATSIPAAWRAAKEAKTPEEKGQAYGNLAGILGLSSMLGVGGLTKLTGAVKTFFEKPTTKTGAEYASTIRSNQGQLRQEGRPAEGRKEAGGYDMEQTPPVQPEPMGARKEPIAPRPPAPETQEGNVQVSPQQAIAGELGIEYRGETKSPNRTLDRYDSEGITLSVPSGSPIEVVREKLNARRKEFLDSAVEKYAAEGLTAKVYPPETPVLGGTINVTDPKTGFTVEGVKPTDLVETVKERLAAKQKADAEAKAAQPLPVTPEKPAPQAQKGNIQVKGPERGLPESATETDLIADMSSAGRDYLSKIKETPDEFTGLDATKLSPADRRNLARIGVSFSTDRANKIVGTWPRTKRVEALRAKVAGQQPPPVTPEKPAAPVAEPELVGMGGATPGEMAPVSKTVTGIRNAVVDQERVKRGLPPAIQPARKAFGKSWDEAMAKIDQDPGYQDRLLGELRQQARALTDVEDAALLHRQIDLQNEYGKATRDLAQAYDDGRLDDVGLEQAKLQGLSDQLLDLYDIGKKVGTETGRGLAARRMLANEDFTLANMEVQRRAANNGKPLTEKQRNEVVEQNKKIAKTQTAYDDYVENKEGKVSEQEATKAVSEIVSKAKKPKATPADIEANKEKLKTQIKLRLDEGNRSSISSLVQRLARMFVEQGVRDRNVLIDSVHNFLKEIDPEISRRDTMDAISGYGQFRQLTKDEISKKLRDLKGQMQQVAKLEDMQAGKPPLKTGMERRIPSPEESRLIKLVNQAKNEFQVPITDEATQLKSSLDMLKTRLKNRTIELKGMLERKEFAKKAKRIIQRDVEANRLHFEMTKAKAAWFEALMKDRLANRSLPAKIFGTGAEALNTSRAILTSADLSAVLRQGGFIAFGHPVRAVKSFPAMFRAFRSQEGQHAVDMEIAKRPNFPLYMQAKLYLSEHGQSLAKMEEAYMSRWADKIPLVAGSQRAYVTFLNKLRADSFDAMANSLARDRELTPTEAKAIANFVNVATGRGDMGMKQNALVGLNTVFFAPSYVASRFQLIAGQPLYRGTARTRLAVAKEYGRFLTGAAVVYALATMDGGEVESDPRSSDFGKLRYGNTRIDPMAGLLQTSVLLGRLGAGETKTTTGKIVPIRGKNVPYGGSTSAEVVGRFLRSKLSPALGTGLNILAGKDVVGQPVTPESTARNLLIPLSLQDIYATMEEQGVPRGSAMGVLSIFGMGLQNYETKRNVTR